MADDGEIDIEGDFDSQIAVEGGFYDANELPSKSANLHPEYTIPPWMLEQGWTLDSSMDEKSKATIERMLQEEQHLYNGKVRGRLQGLDQSDRGREGAQKSKPSNKRPWAEEEKNMFCRGLEIYGRSWTKIAELIPTRTSLQVKNYAQQYFKNLAKKAETPSTSTVSQRSMVDSHQSALATVLATVTTAQPTVPEAKMDKTSTHTLSAPRAVAIKPGAMKLAAKTATKTVGRPASKAASKAMPQPRNPQTNGKSQQRVRQRKVHLSKTELENHLVNADLTPPDVTLLISDAELTEEVAPVNSLFSPSSRRQTGAHSQVSHKSDQASSEDHEGQRIHMTKHDEPDIEVDILNDDEDEDNPVLQSRSTSPSSVYEKLLQSANVDVGSHTETGVDSGEKTSEGQSGVVSPSSSGTPSVKDALEGVGVSSEDSAGGGVASLGQPGQDDGDSSHDRTCAMSDTSEDIGLGEETKVIVNGLLSSSGDILEFPIPTAEVELDAYCISEEEKSVHTEFFDGRPSKTPERYLRIRNYIVDCWRQCQPSYLNKTSVRPGLKNCGDVNCIGRIHAFLECIGAINFNCEQAAYNNPGKSIPSLLKKQQSVKENRQTVSSQKIEAMRPRKRRIRDPYGQWVDTREIEGKTIEHSPVKAKEQLKKLKTNPHIYDPFKLVPCSQFTVDCPSPFQLRVYNTLLAIIDVHCHLCQVEVMGLLGGHYLKSEEEQQGELTVVMAVPCKSLGTRVQCEMDPVSQIEAAEVIQKEGLHVVGWYHSHPVCAPHPSVRDIENQLNFQQHFHHFGHKFIGIIVSPNLQMHSTVQCFTLSNEISDLAFCNTPYQFKPSIHKDMDLSKVVALATELAESYASSPSRVELLQPFNQAQGMSFLDKMLKSVRHNLLREGEGSAETSDMQDQVESTLVALEAVFQEHFSRPPQACPSQPSLPSLSPVPATVASSTSPSLPPLSRSTPTTMATVVEASLGTSQNLGNTASLCDDMSLDTAVGDFSLVASEPSVHLLEGEAVFVESSDMESGFGGMLSPAAIAIPEATASGSMSAGISSLASTSDANYLAYMDRLPMQEIALPDTVSLTL